MMYMYLLGLAMSNLCVLVTAIPALHDISTGLDDTSFATAFYQAHLKLPLINSCMASSVYIIIFMTINRYISIYKPTDFQRLHTAQNAKIHISLSFLAGIFLHIPLCFQNKVVLIENGTCYYSCLPKHIFIWLFFGVRDFRFQLMIHFLFLCYSVYFLSQFKETCSQHIILST